MVAAYSISIWGNHLGEWKRGASEGAPNAPQPTALLLLSRKNNLSSLDIN
jgi:hypothetical protein